MNSIENNKVNHSTFCLFDELADNNCSFERVVKLLNSDDIDLQNVDIKNGNTALHAAAMNYHCDVEVIDLLLRLGADAAATNRFQKTPLHLALENYMYNHEVINKLLENCESLSMFDIDGNTPLHIAVENINCDKKAIKSLIDVGCDMNLKNNKDQTPLDILFKNKSCSVEVVKLLLDNGAEIYEDLYIGSKLQVYIYEGFCKIDIFKELIEREKHNLLENFDCSITGRNLIHMIVMKNNCYDLLSYVVNTLDIDINKRDNFGETPLHIVLRSEQVDEKIVSLLVEHGAGVNILNFLDESLLHYALRHKIRNMKIFEMLLKNGAVVSVFNFDKISPLEMIMKRYVKNPECTEKCMKIFVKYTVKQLIEKYLDSKRLFDKMKSASEICVMVRVLSDLLDDDYEVHHYIVAYFTRSQILQVLNTIPIYCKTNITKRNVVLDRISIFNIFKHLNNIDLFSLFLAFYEK